MKTDRVSFVNFSGSMIPKSKCIPTHHRMHNIKTNKPLAQNKSCIKNFWNFIKETLDEVASLYRF